MNTLNILIMVIVTVVMVTVVFFMSIGSVALAGPQNQFKGEKANFYNPSQEDGR